MIQGGNVIIIESEDWIHPLEDEGGEKTLMTKSKYKKYRIMALGTLETPIYYTI